MNATPTVSDGGSPPIASPFPSPVADDFGRTPLRELRRLTRGLPGRVAVVATAPLTRDETWVRAETGTLWVFRGGRLRATLASHEASSSSRRVLSRARE